MTAVATDLPMPAKRFPHSDLNELKAIADKP